MSTVNGQRSNVTLLRLTQAGLALALLTPLVGSARFMYPLVFPRVVFFRLVVELTAVAYVALAAGNPRFRPAWHAPLVGTLLAYLGVQTVAAAAGVNPYQSFASSLARSEGIITLVHLAAFFAIAQAVLREPKIRSRLLAIAVLVLGLEGILGLAQALHLPGIPLFGNSRPTGLTGNPAYFALLMVFGVWLPQVQRALAAPNGGADAQAPARQRWIPWYWLVSGLSLANLWLTQIRGANFAVMTVGIGWLAWIACRGKSPERRRRAQWLLLAVAAVLTLVLAGRNTPLVTWNKTLERLAQTSWEAITLQNRLISWRVGAAAMSERPWLGWGPENFSVAFDRFFDPALVRDFGSFSWYDRAHSTVVETAVGSGILGLLSYLALYAAAAWQILRLARQSATRRAAPWLASLLAAYVLATAVAVDSINSLVLIFFTLALIAGLSPNPRAAATANARSRRLTAADLVPSGIVAVLLGVTLNLVPALATHAASQIAFDANRPLTAVVRDFQTAFRLSPPQRHEFRQSLGNYVTARLRQSPPPDPQQFGPLVDLALKHLDRSTAVDPGNLQSQLIFSELARELSPTEPKLLAVAQQAADAVIRQAPNRYHGYFAAGRVAMSAGRNRDGITAFRQAVVRYPELGAAHWNLAIAYILAGQLQPAQRAAAAAKRLDENLFWEPANIDKLGRAYADQGFLAPAAALYQAAGAQEAAQADYHAAAQRAVDDRSDRQLATWHNQQTAHLKNLGAEHYRRASHLYRQLGQANDAQASAREAIGLNPVLGAEFSELLEK